VVLRGPGGPRGPQGSWWSSWSSGVLVVLRGLGEAALHQLAVLRLQAEGDALLHLLAAPQEPAAVPGQLLPRATPVLLVLLLATAGKELFHVVTETNLRRRGVRV